MNNTVMPMVNFLITVLLAGLGGGGAMLLAMWLITRGGWAKGNMIVALGSLLTKSRGNAFRVGLVLHAGSAVVFATAYTLVMLSLGVTHLPMTMMLGLGLGVVHGMLVSLTLVWIVAEHHPLEEFNDAGLAVGLSHLAGHVAFGAVVGIVIGLSPV